MAIFAREQNPSFQKCEAEYEATNATQQQPKYFPLFIQRGLALNCTADFVNKYNAVIIAISTVLLTAVTGGLVWMGYLQVRTTRAQLRAYIFPDTASIFDGSTVTPPQPSKNNFPFVFLVIKNTGQTPASEVVSWAQIEIIEPINERTLTIPALEHKFARTIGAGGGFSKSLWYHRALTANEIADLVAGARALYLYGRINYRDIFGKHRFTNFRFYYSGPFPALPGAIFFTCERGNETDMET